MQTPDHRLQAKIFHEKVKLHRNTLNGGFPQLEPTVGWIWRPTKTFRLRNSTNGESGPARASVCPAFHLA
jgi:hypothetical protein